MIVLLVYLLYEAISLHGIQVNRVENHQAASEQCMSSISAGDKVKKISAMSKSDANDVLFVGPEMLDSIPLLHSPSDCSHDVKLVIFIHSAVNNTSRRRLLRQQWSNVTKVGQIEVKIVFILGIDIARKQDLSEHVIPV